MPHVMVWKCPRTGRLFEDEGEYRTHLIQLATRRRELRKIKAEHDAAESWWAQLRDTEIGIDDLPGLIIANQKHFWAESRRSDAWHWNHKDVILPDPELVDFTVFDLDWNDCVSNSHACPHDGVTNWGGRDKLADGTPAPRGYPGWCGRVGWRSKWPKRLEHCYPSGALLTGSQVRIHTGTGGGGAWKNGLQYHEYDVRLFAADWPGLARYREKQVMWERLQGQA